MVLWFKLCCVFAYAGTAGKIKRFSASVPAIKQKNRLCHYKGTTRGVM